MVTDSVKMPEKNVNTLGKNDSDNCVLNCMETEIELEGAVCVVCKKRPDKLMQCSSCHAGKFCSKECFKKGWKRHKKLCQTITDLQSRQPLKIRYETVMSP